ncbi:glycosyltransferase family 2 protein [Nocardioides sp. GCM10028917]|uniref:glycosyltransferase family 2 protein n=1 Tax=Nocardioides sp. GCM10028917 TaxID=3273408 RepID=UPI00362258B9
MSSGSGVDQPAPLVTVVIPTVGRPELLRAIRSAAAQEDVSVDIVVVVDKAEAEVELPDDIHLEAQRVLWTGGGRGGSAARNAGVHASTAPWVAFLDDDDEWLPGKLASQIALASTIGRPHVVVAGRHLQVDAAGATESRPLPTRLIRPGQTVSDYLFRRRRPAGGRASMYTSSLLCDRSLAESVAWDESLRRHQDWDWLVRAQARGDVGFAQVRDPVVRIQTGSSGSISAGKSWGDSLAWATRVLLPLAPAQVTADFLAAQTLRYAVAARSFRGVREVVAAIARTRAMPSIGPLLIACGGLLPRRTVERIMVRVR